MALVHHLSHTCGHDLMPDSKLPSHNVKDEVDDEDDDEDDDGDEEKLLRPPQDKASVPKSFWLDQVWAPGNQRLANDRRGKSLPGRKTSERKALAHSFFREQVALQPFIPVHPEAKMRIPV